jgi:hypothetical protein
VDMDSFQSLIKRRKLFYRHVSLRVLGWCTRNLYILISIVVIVVCVRMATKVLEVPALTMIEDLLPTVKTSYFHL